VTQPAHVSRTTNVALQLLFRTSHVLELCVHTRTHTRTRSTLYTPCLPLSHTRTERTIHRRNTHTSVLIKYTLKHAIPTPPATKRERHPVATHVISSQYICAHTHAENRFIEPERGQLCRSLLGSTAHRMSSAEYNP